MVLSVGSLVLMSSAVWAAAARPPCTCVPPDPTPPAPDARVPARRFSTRWHRLRPRLPHRCDHAGVRRRSLGRRRPHDPDCVGQLHGPRGEGPRRHHDLRPHHHQADAARHPGAGHRPRVAAGPQRLQHGTGAAPGHSRRPGHHPDRHLAVDRDGQHAPQRDGGQPDLGGDPPLRHPGGGCGQPGDGHRRGQQPDFPGARRRRLHGGARPPPLPTATPPPPPSVASAGQTLLHRVGAGVSVLGDSAAPGWLVAQTTRPTDPHTAVRARRPRPPSCSRWPRPRRPRRPPTRTRSPCPRTS